MDGDEAGTAIGGRPGATNGTGGGGAPPEATATLRVPRGTLLNGIYAIDDLIAEGGMGEVYRGHNVQTDDPVAIKLLQPWLSSNTDAIGLFRREASVLHRLAHEAIVRTYVFSIEPSLGRAYLAMEYVDGPPLSERLRHGPLSADELGLLRRRLASALALTHQHGVVHRDIAPDNVLLPGGDVAAAKLIDFGIARSAFDGNGTIIGGGFAGKYNYVSPEQLGLAGGSVTAKSDVYSFGLLLAEAALGRPLDMSGSQAAIIEKRRTVPDLAGIAPELAGLITAMLQPLPDDRPTMAEVAGFVAPAPVVAAAAPTRRPGKAPAVTTAAPPARSPMLRLGLAGLAGVVVLGGAAALLLRGGEAEAPPPAPPPIAAVTPAAPQAPAPQVLPPPVVVTAPTAPAPATRPEVAAPATLSPPSLPPPAAEIAEPPAPPAAVAEPARPVAVPAPPTVTVTPPIGAALRPATPPRAPYPALTLPTATVDQPYRAALPGFTDGIETGRLKVALVGDLPAGLSFRDLGSGFSEIVGTPRQTRSATFALVARDTDGAETRMAVTLPIDAGP
ncbi:serine/threonine-protein kinase [Methylobrevis albus]|uniref:Serine/threonine protein kinase n=1 Tax=Methylobrevis albus TaxID=2793297 RepID=A0A931I287_9HYPH|nr:serine/threonine-protein kinase [Methylobrevis albus]MBH0237553.1 serine/threonine protein kinase [Methylobrevis albus]